MAQKMGVQMIEMYCEMVKTKFKPVLNALQSRKSMLTSFASIEAKRRLGIYDLYVERIKHQARLDEIKEQLKIFEDRKWSIEESRYVCKLDTMVDSVLKEYETAEESEIQAVYDKILWDIRMMGIDENTKSIMNGLDDILADLADRVKRLPEIKIANGDMVLLKD